MSDLRICAFLVALPLALGLVAEAQDLGDLVVDGELGSALDRAVQTTTGGGFWGAVLVARDGKILLAKGYGFADYASRLNTPRTLFEIASLSKQITAAAVLRLEMEGKLRTEDSIEKFFRGIEEEKRAITVHHLLTHTSGISPDRGLPYASRATRDEAVANALAPPLVTKPGEEFAYCNVGYALLAAVIEIASGRSFEEYVEEALFRPAGMTDTGFVRDPDLDRSRVTLRLGEGSDGSEGWTAADWFWGWGYRGMGGVVSTAYDLLAWDRALRGEDVLGRAAKEKMFSPAIAGYACGWLVDTGADGALRAEHGGGVLGYGCHMVRSVDSDAVVIVLSNGRTDPRAVAAAIGEILHPSPSVRAEIDATPYQLSEFQAVELAPGARWNVEKAAHGVRLSLEDPAKGHLAATILLPPEFVEPVVERLERAIATGADDAEAAKAPMDGGLYLGGYDVSEKKLSLAKSLDLAFLPRYDGVTGNGSPILDRRVVLLLGDSATGQWPVMTRMNRAEAKDLAERLRRASR